MKGNESWHIYLFVLSFAFVMYQAFKAPDKKKRKKNQFVPTNFYWYSLMWHGQDLGDDLSPVRRAVRSRGHGSKQTQVSTVERRAALRTFLSYLVSLHKLQHLFYHEPRFDQVKTEYDYNRRLAWDLDRRWARSLIIRLLFIWNNNLIAKMAERPFSDVGPIWCSPA